MFSSEFWNNDLLFFSFASRIGLPTDKSRINYAEFLEAFEDGRKSSYGRQPRDIRIDEYRKLNPEEAEKKLKERLEANVDDVTKVVSDVGCWVYNLEIRIVA